MTGITKRQLRYWDHISLVRPSLQDNRDPGHPNGRPGKPKFWSEADVSRVRLIKVLAKEAGSLQKARRLLAAEDRRLAVAGRGA